MPNPKRLLEALYGVRMQDGGKLPPGIKRATERAQQSKSVVPVQGARQARQAIQGYLGMDPSFSVMDPEAQALESAYRGGETASVLGDLFASLTPFAAASAAAKANQLPGLSQLIAYHGSPHKFKKFDASKIGTGEGAQAYGHGLYFAENPKVAKDYAVNLANRDLANQGRLNAHANAQRLVAMAGDPKYAADDIRFALEVNPNHEQAGLLKATLEMLESGAYAKPLKTEGSLYTVDIPDEKIAQMLDWDKPLSQQPKAVQEAINSIVLGEELYKGKYAPRFLDERTTGGEAIEIFNSALGSPQITSNYLREAGIPGIQYLDQASRDAKQGTRNFVLFPGEEQNIKMLDINGEPQMAAGGAVSMQVGGSPMDQMFNFNPMAAKAAKQKQMRESTPETPLGALGRGFATGLFGSAEEQVPYTGSIMEGTPERQQSQANLREIGRNIGALTDIGGMVTPFAKPAAQAVTRGATALGKAGLEQVDRAMFGEGPLAALVAPVAPMNVNAPVSKLGFYNAIEETATTLQRKQGPGQAFLNEFTKAGISKQRLEDAGIAQKLAATPNITREEVQALTKGTLPDVEEVVLSRSVIPPYMKGFADLHMPDLNVNDSRQVYELRRIANERYKEALEANDLDAAEFAMKAEEDITKFNRTHSYGTKPGERLTEYHEYQEPGGKNYREVLLKVPYSEKYDDNFRSPHWSDPNVISHIRMNDRVDADNKNVLFIEELQSDWAQEGRKHGFKDDPTLEDRFNKLSEEHRNVVAKRSELVVDPQRQDEYKALADRENILIKEMNKLHDAKQYGPLSGPFVKNTNEWVDLSLKNIIKRAVDEGYDRVAFIDGYKSFLRFPQGADGKSTEAGMRKFYDEVVPSRLKTLVGKDNVRTIPGITQQPQLDVSLHGNRYFVVDADTDIPLPNQDGFRSVERAEQYLDELLGKTKSMEQIGFDITPEIREKFSKPIPYKKGGAVSISDSPDVMLLELTNAPKMQAGGSALKAFREQLEAQAKKSLAKDPRFKQAPGQATNLAGKSYAQWAAEQQYKHELEDALAKISGAPEKKMSIQDLPVGSRLVSIVGDRTQADKILRSVNETPLANEVILHGGPRFGQGKLAQGKEDFWASNAGAAQAVQNRVEAAAERAKGNPVIGVYTAMGAGDSDMYAKHFAESLIEQYPFTGMTGKQVDAFNKEFRKKYPQFAGVDNPDFVDQIMTDSKMRKAFVDEHLKKKNIEKFNIPDGLATRHAITVPELRDVPTGLAGYSLGRMQPGTKLQKELYTEHPTYDTVIPGEFIGGLELMQDYRDLFPDATQRMLQTLRNNPKFQGPDARRPESQLFGTFSMQGAEQEVTQKLIDELAAREQLIKQLGILPYKKGGKVKKVKISNNPDAMQLELMRKKKHA